MKILGISGRTSTVGAKALYASGNSANVFKRVRTFLKNKLILSRPYHVWWAIEDVFHGAKSFVKQLSLIAAEIELVNLIK